MEQDKIDRILELTNIVDVISSYFPLKKAGTNFKALCPFHQEKTPSFLVSEKKQIYKCFGCGKAGNAVSFIMDYEKISFLEAMKKLASRVGINIETTEAAAKKHSRRDLIYKIYELACAYYRQNLEEHGAGAWRYLEARNISRETVDSLQIGLALNSFSGLKNYLLQNHINEQILPRTGLFSSGEKGLFDTFRDRIIFPIHSVTGKVVAFGGRVLRDDQPGGKYINSPTTEIYTKGNELYGLFRTRFEISRQDSAIICEGYTDFLRLYEKGFANTVASLGTSLTTTQIHLLARYTSNVFLLYDGDPAGINAAVKAAGNLIKAGIAARIISLPPEDDPDSFLLKQDPEKLRNLLQQAKPLTEFLDKDNRTGLDVKGKLDLLVEIINEIGDEIGRELFVKEVAEVFRISERALFSRIKIPYVTGRNKPAESKLHKFREERELLKHVLNNREYFKKVAKELNPDYFLFKIYKDIYEILIKYPEKINQAGAMLEYATEETTRNLLAELLIEDVHEYDFMQALQAVKLRKYQKDLQVVTEQLRSDPSNKELLDNKNELKRLILTLDKKVVRKTLY
ncbi:MAG: DNA primase [Candidatus Cloacimonetes bacterium]|nr:DNA primase [Candidatus Cloacimonadota bacterium]